MADANKKTVMLVWNGSAIEKCDFCGEPIVREFIDGKTKRGSWAIMCLACHNVIGVGLGVGKGQHYMREWVKVRG